MKSYPEEQYIKAVSLQSTSSVNLDLRVIAQITKDMTTAALVGSTSSTTTLPAATEAAINDALQRLAAEGYTFVMHTDGTVVVSWS